MENKKNRKIGNLEFLKDFITVVDINFLYILTKFIIIIIILLFNVPKLFTQVKLELSIIKLLQSDFQG